MSATGLFSIFCPSGPGNPELHYWSVTKAGTATSKGYLLVL